MTDATAGLPGASRLHIDTLTQPSCVWILLRGEADIAATAVLDNALEGIQLTEHQSVHLHLEGLGFADVTTMRQLATFARRVREAGHPVMTCRAKPMLRWLAESLGVQDELGVIPASPSLPVAP